MKFQDSSNNKEFANDEQLSHEKNIVRAKNISYRYLTICSRSRKELEQKLAEKKFESDVIRIVVDNLILAGYINDDVFAVQWACSRIKQRSFGRRRIAQELQQKGIDKEIIREALVKAITHEDECQAAQRATEQKLKSMKNIEPEARKRRLAGFLQRKGFSYDIIYTMLPLAGLK